MAKKSQAITMSIEEFMAANANGGAFFKAISPYANLTEADVNTQLHELVLASLITESSYFAKCMSKEDKENAFKTRQALLESYQKCRDYATQSIIDSLYPVDKIEKPVQHLSCEDEKFYILSRVRTNYERPTIEETAKERPYLSFTLNSERNLSHFPGLVWYGYRSGIVAEMIGLIKSLDADTRNWARNRMELGAEEEELLDAEDLITASLQNQTYPQISVKTQGVTCVGPVIHQTPINQDCVLCIDQIDDNSKRASDQYEIPILVLHPGFKTFCRIHDYFNTDELKNPQYF